MHFFLTMVRSWYQEQNDYVRFWLSLLDHFVSFIYRSVTASHISCPSPTCQTLPSPQCLVFSHSFTFVRFFILIPIIFCICLFRFENVYIIDFFQLSTPTRSRDYRKSVMKKNIPQLNQTFVLFQDAWDGQMHRENVQCFQLGSLVSYFKYVEWTSTKSKKSSKSKTRSS